MKTGDVLRAIDARYPFAAAEEWDNSGLIIGDREADVTKIVFSLNADERALETALREGANLIVAHHPLIFRPLKRLDESEPQARLIARMIRAGVSVVAAHTNFDASDSGTSFLLARALGLQNITKLGAYTVSGDFDGRDFIETARKNLNCAARVYGEFKPGRVAVCAGAGGEYWREAIGMSAFLTGEIKYHDALEAEARGLCAIEAGHAETEAISIPALADCVDSAIARIVIV